MTTKAVSYIVAPEASPIAATSQRLAAVVRPLTVRPLRRIAPAPRKLMPETTEAAMREKSAWEKLFGS